MKIILEVLSILILFLIKIEESIEVKRNNSFNFKNYFNINLNDFIFIKSFKVIEKYLII